MIIPTANAGTQSKWKRNRSRGASQGDSVHSRAMFFSWLCKIFSAFWSDFFSAPLRRRNERASATLIFSTANKIPLICCLLSPRGLHLMISSGSRDVMRRKFKFRIYKLFCCFLFSPLTPFIGRETKTHSFGWISSSSNLFQLEIGVSDGRRLINGTVTLLLILFVEEEAAVGSWRLKSYFKTFRLPMGSGLLRLVTLLRHLALLLCRRSNRYRWKSENPINEIVCDWDSSGRSEILIEALFVMQIHNF